MERTLHEEHNNILEKLNNLDNVTEMFIILHQHLLIPFTCPLHNIMLSVKAICYSAMIKRFDFQSIVAL